jgi:hypothetical protein
MTGTVSTASGQHTQTLALNAASVVSLGKADAAQPAATAATDEELSAHATNAAPHPGKFTNHAALSNLSWTASGHTGTPARIAGFFEGGAAGYAGFGEGLYLDGSDNIAVSNNYLRVIGITVDTKGSYLTNSQGIRGPGGLHGFDLDDVGGLVDIAGSPVLVFKQIGSARWDKNQNLNGSTSSNGTF